ncbi:signal peptidase II [Methylophilus aquaticus]|uniref:Lipoprotein signal peptidase n=1 Tax=Methylophilus aquaticus TaxID=1971610 RepID=A0ABT9JS29_9PROT|nr:signal peptidase II [Methylophilus aquaticus]MDP8567376.1 signal peptidase II [Methylophilus aquaticus]
MRKLKTAAPWFGLSALVIVLDLYTKHLIQSAFLYGEHLPVTGFFDLVRYHNTGAAFSFLANAGGWQHGFFTAVSTLASAVMVYLILKNQHNTLFCLGLALVLGGALGNLYDRLTLGYVVDFLLFYYQQWAWPAFNVADSAICVGVGVLLLDSFKTPDPS